jgi:hypothetical protein
MHFNPHTTPIDEHPPFSLRLKSRSVIESTTMSGSPKVGGSWRVPWEKTRRGAREAYEWLGTDNLAHKESRQRNRLLENLNKATANPHRAWGAREVYNEAALVRAHTTELRYLRDAAAVAAQTHPTNPALEDMRRNLHDFHSAKYAAERHTDEATRRREELRAQLPAGHPAIDTQHAEVMRRLTASQALRPEMRVRRPDQTSPSAHAPGTASGAPSLALVAPEGLPRAEYI